MKAIKLKNSGKDTKNIILKTASQCFFEDGYDGVSIRMIASQVGISAPSIYNHFKSKQELLYSCLEFELKSLTEQTKQNLACHKGEPKLQLAAFIKSQINFNFERQGHDISAAYVNFHGLNSLQNKISAIQSKSIQMVELVHLNILRSILQEGMDKSVFKIDGLTPTAFAIIGIIEHVSAWFNPVMELGLKGVTDHAIRMCYRMVGTE